jgi:hypothetical protein
VNYLRGLLVCLVVTLALVTGPARAVNLHNGYIIIRNDGDRTLNLMQIDHHTIFANTRIQPFEKIAPHSTFIANGCCYAAGSWYAIEISYSGRETSKIDTKEARLCNINGIPFGFAAFAYSDYHPGNNANPGDFRVQGGRIDTGCPS